MIDLFRQMWGDPGCGHHRTRVTMWDAAGFRTRICASCGMQTLEQRFKAEVR